MSACARVRERACERASVRARVRTCVRARACVYFLGEGEGGSGAWAGTIIN